MVIKFTKHPYCYWGENCQNGKRPKREAWTSIYDVGLAMFPKLTLKRYFEVEDKCFLFVKHFLKAVNISKLTFRGMEYHSFKAQKARKYSSDKFRDITPRVWRRYPSSLAGGTVLGNMPVCEYLFTNVLHNNLTIPLDNFFLLEIIFKMISRELFWGYLVGEKHTFIHFGYDLYYYVGSDRLKSIEQLDIPTGVWAKEIVESPYSDVCPMD